MEAFARMCAQLNIMRRAHRKQGNPGGKEEGVHFRRVVVVGVDGMG